MPKTHEAVAPVFLPELPLEWSDAALQAARNLGLDASPAYLSPEHWQRVLANVETRMRLRGFDAPAGWRDTLAERFGRDRQGRDTDGDFPAWQPGAPGDDEGGFDGPES